MLFSNTCVVEAASLTQSYSGSWTVHWTWDYYNSSNYNGTTQYNTGAGSEWFELGFQPALSLANFSDADYIIMRLQAPTVSAQNCDSWYITDMYNNVVYTSNSSGSSTYFTKAKKDLVHSNNALNDKPYTD